MAEVQVIDEFKEIERHLKNYKNYKIGIMNLKKQLDYCFPRITSSYELNEGSSGGFSVKSDTEIYGIKRIDKAHALEEEVREYGLIIDSIEKALKQLDSTERDFIEYRYFNNWNVRRVANKLGYSVRSVHTIRNEVKKQLLISLINLAYIK
jgi:RinA family phage transcriptional activator